jgi:hypothetical protein
MCPVRFVTHVSGHQQRFDLPAVDERRTPIRYRQIEADGIQISQIGNRGGVSVNQGPSWQPLATSELKPI